MVKIWRISLFSVVMLLALLWQAGSASASSGWVVVPSVNPPGDDTFFAIAATSTKDVWSVGSANQGGTPVTLAEHWNGSSWSVVPSPNPGSTFNKLFGVTALSSSNAWAVGYYQNNLGGVSTLIEHWNGTKWSVVTSPNPVGITINQLWGVSAASASNIWAIGTSQTGNNVTQTLTEHWNGKAWSIVPSSNPGASFSSFKSVVAVSATSAWAVGNYINQQGTSQTLIEHWNGTQWSIVPGANPGSSNYLFGVTAVPGSSQLWAVGKYVHGGAGQSLTEKWNGTSWSVVTSPTIQTNGNVLNSVTAISATNIWAAGEAGIPGGIVPRGGESASSAPQGKTLILHWNGTRWSMASSPNPGTFDNSLSGVAYVPGTSQLWAAGGYNNGSRPVYTLIEYHQ